MNQVMKITLLIAGAIIVIAGGYLLLKAPTSPTSNEPIKIGVLADLSGDYVNFLRGIPRGAELAVEDLKNETNREIKLIVEDQKSCDAKEAATIMNKFVGVDGVDLIIGGTCSNTTLAAAPIANQNKIIMISAASSAPSVSQAGDYIFRTYISDILRAKQSVELMYSLGKRRMAVITETTNDAAIELAEGSKAAFIAAGGAVQEEKITNKDTDFRTQLTKIKAFNPDLLGLYITGPNQIGLVAKQATELGIKVQLLVPFETAEDKVTIETGNNAVNGLIYVMPGNPPETDRYQKLKNKYLAKYGENEMPSYVTEAYDAVMLGVRAVLASNGSKENIKDKLYEVSKSYEGVSGSVVFDANGDINKPLLFKTIKNGQFVPYGD